MIERSTTNNRSIELVIGYHFGTSKNIIAKKMKFDRPRIVIIDGFIESVSELHLLLEEAAASKEHVILFTRGMNDDVTHTLKVNYERGSLSVIPITMKFDYEGVNTMVDIAKIAGSDIVSTFTGQLISSVRLNSFKKVDSVLIHEDEIFIMNQSTLASVKNHVSDLTNKRASQENEAIGALLDSRIRSLSPNHVVIRLIDDSSFVRSSQDIDYVLRTYKSMMSHGVIRIGSTRQLASSYLASNLYSKRCVSMLNDVGAMLLDEVVVS